MTDIITTDDKHQMTPDYQLCTDEPDRPVLSFPMRDTGQMRCFEWHTDPDGWEDVS